VTTVGWALVYASRVVVQVVLYQADRPGIMAASKILMGWPLTILAVVVTLAYIGHAARRTGVNRNRAGRNRRRRCRLAGQLDPIPGDQSAVPGSSQLRIG
jgi:hypothetical protein